MISGLCAAGSAAVLINEVDSDTPGSDADEFIELKGNPGESTDGLILVLFSGTATGADSYRNIDLAGLQCDAQGYLLIADANVMGGGDLLMPNGFIRNGECAVALYEDSVDNFTTNTQPTTNNLKDVIIHHATGASIGNWSGFGTPPKVKEGNTATESADFSVARLPDGSANWAAGTPTPRAANHTERVEITNTFVRPRFNQFTVQQPTSFTVTLKNRGPNPINVTRLDLATTSSAAYSTVTPATPALPATLAYGQTVALVVQLKENNEPLASQVYTAVINYATDTATSPSGSYEVAREMVRATVTAPVDAVVINEICYNPGTTDHNGDGNTASQNDEFVELYNTTNAPILIEGWEQRCTDGLGGPVYHSYVFPAGAVIPANGFVTVFTSGTPTGFLPGTTFTYGIPRINNGGSQVYIHDATKIVDGLAYGAGADNPDVDQYTNTGVTAGAGSSLGRRPDGEELFRTFLITDPILTNRPTPNTTNSPTSQVSGWTLY